jgi:hypothetical protein
MRILSISALAGCVGLMSSVLFAIPTSAESAYHRRPVPAKRHLLDGLGGGGIQKSTNSDKGPDGSEQPPVASTGQGGGAGGGGSAAGAGGQGGQSDHTGVAARLADVAGDVFGYSGASNSNHGDSGVHGAPGPIAGAGLPFLGIGYGVYWLIRRRRNAH